MDLSFKEVLFNCIFVFLLSLLPNGTSKVAFFDFQNTFLGIFTLRS